MSNRTKIIVAVFAVVGIIGSTWLLFRDDNRSDNSQANNTNSNQTVNEGTINKDSEDYQRFSQFKGDEFDRIFLANMIEHHKGAVDMAVAIKNQTTHNELAQMVNEVIRLQSKEIAQMEKWQKDWGYPSSSGEMMMDHSAMGMTGEMATMTSCLDGLDGERLEETFLALMIKHHQSAIDMSGPANTNAKHDEVKQLAREIIQAQSKEIQQMKEWQQQWDYDPWGTAIECMGH